MIEDNIHKVLGVKSAQDTYSTKKIEPQYDDAAENVLISIANIVLWAGIISTVFCLLTLTTTKVVDPTYHYSIHYDTIFNPGGLAISVGVLLSTFTTWAVLKVIANISNTLKEINSKMK